MNLALNDQNMDISLSDISVMAQAGDETSDNNYYKSTWSETETEWCFTEDGCPDGEYKNCTINKTTTHITCIPGGNEACIPGSSTSEWWYCGNCIPW